MAVEMKKPVIHGKSPAIPKEINHGIHIYLCDRGSAESLAEAIKTLKSQALFRHELACNGYEIFQEFYAIKPIGKQIVDHLSYFSK